MFTTTKKKQRKQHKKTLKKLHCNPSNKTELIVPQSCLKKSTIYVVRDAFNEHYPEKAIKSTSAGSVAVALPVTVIPAAAIPGALMVTTLVVTLYEIPTLLKVLAGN